MSNNIWAAIEAEITKKLASALQNECFEEIRDTEQSVIDEVVYDVYSPKIYDRRDISGGLIADENIKLNIIDDLTIKVTNDTPANLDYNGTDKNLAELVEFGNGYNNTYYDYPRNLPYVEPRPFTEETVERLKQNKNHIKALRKGLSRQGVITFQP
jgi:hypothetical protein